MKPFNLRVLIADDHPAVRIGIESTLRESQAVTVVGAARDSTEMMEMLKQHDCQILVSDYAMPGGLHGDGIALFALVRQRYPRLKIVVMTMLDNPGIIHSLLDIGVPCILNKADSVSHLLPAVHAAYASGRYLSPSMAEIAARTAPHRTDTQPHAMLSKRELEVVRMFVSGLTVTEIAERLHRSKKTISTQKGSAMAKLGILRDMDLVRYGMETGLMSTSAAPPPPLPGPPALPWP